jgi:acetolactate decarboxylase
MKFSLLLLLIVILNQSCNNREYFSVRHAGALKDIMHQGDLSSKIKLDTLKNISNLYALGALENLKGEILILNGEPFISSVGRDSLIVNRSFNHNAALLVFTQIKKWKEIAIPEHVRNYRQVEAFIPEAAKKHKLNTNEPFPFAYCNR